MIIVPGPASVELGRDVASLLGADTVELDHRIFPDGESYIRFKGDLRGETCAIVQTTAPDPDRKLMQLLMMLKTAKEMGAKRIIACVPYLGYSRQDKRFLDGEVLTLDVVLSLLSDAGASDLLAVDIHNMENTGKLAEKYPMRVHFLDAMPVIAEHLKGIGYDGAYSVSPDAGRKDIVGKASSVLGGGFGFFDKHRDRHTGEIVMRIKDLALDGRNAVVFDDIISSGGTMARAVAGLKEQGAGKVAAACTHALFMPGAEEKLTNAGADLILAADTVATPYSAVTVSGLIAERLRGF